MLLQAFHSSRCCSACTPFTAAAAGEVGHLQVSSEGTDLRDLGVHEMKCAAAGFLSSSQGEVGHLQVN